MEAVGIETINLKPEIEALKARHLAAGTQGLLDQESLSQLNFWIGELEAHQQEIEKDEKRKSSGDEDYLSDEARRKRQEDNQKIITSLLTESKKKLTTAEEKLIELNQRQNLVATCMTHVCANYHIFKALQHFHLGNYRGAMSAAQKSLNHEEDIELSNRIIAMCRYKKKDPTVFITEDEFSAFQKQVSLALLNNKIKSDLELALKYFRKKKYVKAIAAANDCIDKGTDIHFAHLLVALSLYNLKSTDPEHLHVGCTPLRQGINFPPSTAKLSTREAFAKEWAECLFNSFSLQISDVVVLIQKGLNSNLDEQERTQTREKLKGLVTFDDEHNPIKLNKEQLGAYTTYQILKELRAQKVITTGQEYVKQLNDLGVKKTEDANLHRKIKRQIDQHDPLHPVKRAAARGAQSARQFLKAAGDKRFVSAVLKFADEYRRAKISGPIDVVFHLLPHVVPLIFSAIGYAATAIFAGIRWILSPIIGRAIVKAEEKAVDKKAVELPVKLFKYEHVGKGAGLAFFAAVTPPRSEQLMQLGHKQLTDLVR